MREDLLQIDTSAIEQLVRIKEEQGVLKDRLQKMDANREAVSEVVYHRVRKDYEQRLSAVEAEALPLKNHARREYSKLRTLQLGMERALQDARLEKEELEFRNSLGEFEKGEFTARVSESEAKLAERQGDLDEAIQLKARFLTAFNSEEELNADAPPAMEVPAPARTTAPATPPPFSEPTPYDATAIAGAEHSPFGHSLEHHGPESHPPPPADATAVAWFAESPSFSPPFHADASPSPVTYQGSRTTEPGMPPPAMDAPYADATQVAPISAWSTGLASARIVALVADGEGQEWVLPPGMTSIGRSPKAQIRVIEESVSRQHAQLIVGPDGCKIVDMGSENGTNVNGMRVTEQFLSDGDLIQIGSQRFVFRR